MIRRGRVHHAQLFSGPEGVGKARVARAFVAAFFCEEARKAGVQDGCGTCRSCRWVAAGTHPDVLVVEPDGQTIRREQVMSVVAATNFRPVSAPARFVLIEEAHALGEEAANAMLKTLEEPSGETHFILLTDQPQRLLTTIVSRVQTLSFGGLAPEALADVLDEDAPPAVRRRVAALAQGSVGQALHWLESDRLERHDALMEALLALRTGDVLTASQLAETVGGRPTCRDEELESIRMLAHEAARVSMGLPPSEVVSEHLRASLVRCARERGVRFWCRWAEEVDEAASWMTLNLPARLSMDEIMMRFVTDPSARGEEKRR